MGAVVPDPHSVTCSVPFQIVFYLLIFALLPPVQSQKAQKIDLNVDYPCPCHRRGRLTPIALTEAFGCNRCQRFFVVQENGYVIEELPTTYSYKRTWRWTGHQWSIVSPSLGRGYFPLALIGLGVFIILLLATQSTLSSSPAVWAIAFLALLLLIIVFWLACRR